MNSVAEIVYQEIPFHGSSGNKFLLEIHLDYYQQDSILRLYKLSRRAISSYSGSARIGGLHTALTSHPLIEKGNNYPFIRQQHDANL